MRALMRFWFYCLVVITPFLFTAVNDELFEFNKMLFVYGITIFVALTWAIWSLRARQIIWRSHFLLPFMGLFLVSQVLSTLFSIHIPTSVFGYYSRFHGGLLSTISYLVLMQAAISTLHKTDVRPLIRAALVGMVGVCLYAIPEHFGFSPSCVLITGQADVSCWVQDVQTRVFATFGQPNWLAAYLLIMIPLAAWDFLTQTIPSSTKRNRKFWTWFPFVAVILGVTTLIFTKSRSGELGFVLGGLTTLTTISWSWWRRQDKAVKKRLSFPWNSLAILAAAVLFPILIFGFNKWSGVEALLASPTDITPETVAPVTGTQLENGGTDSGKIRLIVWEGALKVWQRYPLLGSGVETFAYSYYQDRPRIHNDISEWDFLYNKAHNEFLNFLATTGILGLLSYVGFILAGSWLYLRYGVWDKKAPFEIRWAGALWLGASVGLAVSNFFGFSTVMVGMLFFLLPALWVLLADEENDDFDPPPDAWENLGIWSWAGILAVSGASLWGLAGLAQMWNNDHLLAISKAALNAGDSQLAYTSVLQLTKQGPQEAGFWEQRAVTLSRLAVGLVEVDATTAAQLAMDADQSSLTMLELNPRHLNFWKSRVRVLLFLGALDNAYLDQAIVTLQEARKIAPTDSKLTYNLALIYETLDNTPEAEKWYRETLQLRPNYEEAQYGFGQLLERLNKPDEAMQQYREILRRNPEAINVQQQLEALEASSAAQTQTSP